MDSTPWTGIRGAAAGEPEQRSLFVRSDAPVIRACLRARRKSSNLLQEADDAVQEVFLDGFKHGGVLHSADPARHFRPYLYGVLRNAARHAETRRARNKEQATTSGFDPGRDPQLSQIFDRAWALAVVLGALDSWAPRPRNRGRAGARRRVAPIWFGNSEASRTSP